MKEVIEELNKGHDILATIMDEIRQKEESQLIQQICLDKDFRNFIEENYIIEVKRIKKKG